MNIDPIIKWLIERVNEVNHGKVGIIFNIIDDKIEWIQKIYDPTEKPVDKEKPVYYSNKR